MTDVCILGVTGRMGGEILAALAEDDAFTLVGAASRPNSSALGARLAKTPVRVTEVAEALVNAQVAIDFSLPAAVNAHLAACIKHNVPYVCGVTGLSDNDQRDLIEASARIPVLWAPNMSIGVNVCFGSVAAIARQLEGDFSVSILDIHHAGKVDAPSGTALEFGRHIQEAAGAEVDITYKSVREGTHPGEHHIQFDCVGDKIEVRHRAGSRTEFAIGALRAASWLKDQAPGRYNMQNLLEI